MKNNLLKSLRKRYYWRIENGNWVVYDKNQNNEFTIKKSNSNDAIINLLVSSIGVPFTCLEVRKLKSEKIRLKNRHQAKFTNSFKMF